MYPSYSLPVHLQADLFPREFNLAELTLPKKTRKAHVERGPDVASSAPAAIPLSSAVGPDAPSIALATETTSAPTTCQASADDACAQVRKQRLRPRPVRHVVSMGLRDELRISIANTLRLVRRPMTVEEIADACDCSAHRAKSLLAELIAAGSAHLAMEPDLYMATPLAQSVH